MTVLTTCGVLRRTARIAIAGAAILGAVQGASADDAGIHQFFSAIFGGAAPQPEAAPSYAYAPSTEGPRRSNARPLTVRLHKPKPKVVVAQEVPVKPGKVSIFEDRTLRPGDAVMTAKGIRVFAGSRSWPYVASDFVGLDGTKDISKDTSRVLAQLDRVPRG